MTFCDILEMILFIELGEGLADDALDAEDCPREKKLTPLFTPSSSSLSSSGTPGRSFALDDGFGNAGEVAFGIGVRGLVDFFDSE